MAETVVCVGAVVRRNNAALLVRQSPGHPLGGLWTIPWGQVDRGESPTAAALREVREEAGVTAAVDGLLGLQELPEPWLGMLGILFLCAHVDGDPVPDARETDAARYFGAAQLEAIADSLEPLSAWIVRRVLAEDFILLQSNDSGPFMPSPTYL
ncbi:MAG: NUDIX domain-containing protein [Xanthomonadales bacterium]|nr:NUDIX domain-containing protein [Xanthomonadales bacterium]